MAAIVKQQPETIQSSLAALTARMRATILRALASRALIDRRHVACAIATADARIVQIDNPARLAVADAVLHSVLAMFDGTLIEGDIVLTNDPFSGGTHLQDVSLVTPIFLQGKLVGYGIVQVPLADIGGQALGGYYPFALEIWAEGVRVTPVKFYRRGQIQRDALTMLLLNSRLPHLLEKDLEIVVGALTHCKTEVASLAAQYTLADYHQGAQKLLADTEAQARKAIKAFTFGKAHAQSVPIHSCLEDKEFRVVTRLSTVDDTVRIDFSDSSPAAKGFINATATTTKAAALLPFYGLWHSLAVNGGLLRVFSFVIPEGSLLNAKVPTSVGWSVYEPSLTVAYAVDARIQQAQLEYVSVPQIGGTFSPPALPFTITGCGRPGCPFPSLPRA
jgi:N-methylhydantoinase B